MSNNTTHVEVIKITDALKHQIEKDSRHRKALFYAKCYPVKSTSHSLTPKWSKMQSILQKVATIGNVTESGSKLLKSTLFGYCNISRDICNFGVVQDHELSLLFAKHLPAIARHALKLQDRLSKRIELMRNGENKTFYFTRNLACSLVAHAVLCTMTKATKMDGLNPNFNFLKLYHETTEDQKTKVKREKLKCFLEYFNQIERMPESEGHSIISFERRCRRATVDWSQCQIPLCDVFVSSGGRIEEAKGMLQVDFANRSIGGGVLGSGAVQEEIRFCISPELICAMLFSDPLGHDEVLVVTGTKLFCTYSGYGSTFKFQKLKSDPWSNVGEKDKYGRSFTQVVAMDAWHYKHNEKMQQYKVDRIDRDLHKSYVGFMHGQRKTPVATGLWGCGAFNGDPELKFLIQWMAASVNARPEMKFFAGGDCSARKIREVKDLVLMNGITVATLYNIICNYGKDEITGSGFFKFVQSTQAKSTVFDYVKKSADKASKL